LPRVAVEWREQTALRAPVIAEIETLLAKTDWRVARPRLLHADLTEDHLLIDPKAGRWAMSGLLDWADAEVGDPYYDWVALWFSICRRQRPLFEAFRRGYDPVSVVGSIDRERLAAFTFLHRFGAGILGDVLSPTEQNAAGSVDELIDRLFAGLDC
jgi:aminoglycoside phosphotransferase (APT) family kinase protein